MMGMALTVDPRDTRDALLGDVGEGLERGQCENSVVGCAEDDLPWHIELSAPVDEARKRQAASAIDDRIEGPWGVSRRRYLAHRGDRLDQLDHLRAAE